MSAVAEPFVRFDFGDLFLVDRTVHKSIVDSFADAAASSAVGARDLVLRVFSCHSDISDGDD